MNKAAKAFMDRVQEKTGHPVMLYSFGYFFVNHVDKNLGYPVWYARYANSPIGADLKELALWQHTDSGTAGGLHPIDLNTTGGRWGFWDADDPKPVIKPVSVKKPESKPKEISGVYIVEAGDTLSEIAAAHHMSTHDLAQLNGIEDVDVIHIGQRLNTKTPARKVAGHADKVYTVHSGDTLSALAIKLHTSQRELMRLNGIDNANVLSIGQKLKYNGKQEPTVHKTMHKVVSGDTVSELAHEYGSTLAQIKSWNHLNDNYTIYAGQSLRVK